MQPSLFNEINDELFVHLDEDFSKAFKYIREFMKCIDLSSYSELGKTYADHKDDLIKIENTLKEILCRKPKITEQKVNQTDVINFLRALKSSLLFVRTVGDPSECISSVNLQSFLKYENHTFSESEIEGYINLLVDKFNINSDTLDDIDQNILTCGKRLDLKYKLINQLRKRVLNLNSNELDRNKLKVFVDLLIPHHPFYEEELDVIVTQTAFYICIPSLKIMENLDSYKKRNQADKDAVVEFIKLNKRFKFEQFENFPVFSYFDSGNTDKNLLRDLSEALQLSQFQCQELLNSSLMIHETDQLEKYFIHDTWGHVWQSELAQTKYFYDKLANLNYPLSPDKIVNIKNNVVAFSDIFFVNHQGELSFSRECASLFCLEYLHEKVNAMFTPICAELCADMVEYFYNIDHSDLPSSSLFKHNPTKIDFAWADINYFIKSIRRADRVYRKDDELCESFISRLDKLIARKYSKSYKNISDRDSYKEDLKKGFYDFLDILDEHMDKHLNIDLDIQESASVSKTNDFFKMLTNFLQIQFTVNHLIHEYFESEKPINQYRNILILFIIFHLENDPKHNFWNMDETLANSFAQLVNICENSAHRS